MSQAYYPMFDWFKRLCVLVKISNLTSFSKGDITLWNRLSALVTAGTTCVFALTILATFFHDFCFQAMASTSKASKKSEKEGRHESQ